MFNHLNPNDYQTRLNQTIVRYGLHPVVVHVESADRFIVHPVHPGSEFSAKTIKATDENLDVSTVPLGYMNFEYDGSNMVVYIDRQPVRRWQQGVCANNLRAYRNSGSAMFGSENAKAYLSSKGFEDMVLGKYPSLTDALRMINSKSSRTRCVALSRDIAVGISDIGVYNIFLKKDLVAYANRGDRDITIPADASYPIYKKCLSVIDWRF